MSGGQIAELSSTDTVSVTVNGKQYSASVTSSNGQYSATASGVTGVTGSGSTEDAAEAALEMSLSAMA